MRVLVISKSNMKRAVSKMISLPYWRVCVYHDSVIQRPHVQFEVSPRVSTVTENMVMLSQLYEIHKISCYKKRK